MQKHVLIMALATLAAAVPAASAASSPVNDPSRGRLQGVDWPETGPYSSSHPLLQAIEAYRDNGPAAAKPFLLESAGFGNVVAMRILGLMYARGEGVPVDGQEAIQWFRIAAERGDGESMYILGVAFANGIWVARDREAAVRWLRRAVELKVPNAGQKLRSLHRQGD